MKRIILSTLLAFSFNFSFAQDMTPEQIEALQKTAKELYPSSDNQRNSWLKTQQNAFNSIKLASFALSDEEVIAIKQDAATKFPNNYLEQEAYVRSKANDMVNMNKLSTGLDAEEFAAIKNVAQREAKGDANEYMNLIRAHLDAKDKMKTASAPEGVDEVDFKIIQRVLQKNYQNNYRKQLDLMGEKAKMLLSIMGESTSTEDVLENLKDDPNAFNTIGLEIVKNNSIIVGKKTPQLAIAVKFKDKFGFFCPMTALNDELELITPMGEKVEIQKIHLSKTAPVMFLETGEFPEGISALSMTTLNEVKANLNKELTLAGYTSLTNTSCYKIAINSIRDNIYILDKKTPLNFTDGTMLVDYENAKLVSFTLRGDNENIEIPSFKEKNKVMALLRKTGGSSRSAKEESYPILDMLNDFEAYDAARMQSQVEFLEDLKADNEEAFKLYTATALSTLASSSKYGKIAKDNASKFKDRIGEKNFLREAKSLMSKLSNEIKKDFKPETNPNLFYINLRADVALQMELRKQLIEYYKNAVANDLESILPKDILPARQEPYKKR
ncbi:MAG: hypothetical protein R3Y46_00190 [Opitutales bacterium]